MMRYWNYDLDYGMYPGFSILGFLFQVLFWGMIIMLVVKIFKHSRHQHHCHDEMSDEEMNGDKSLGIIKERYAKGEIDKKEFEQLKKDLS